MQNSYYNTYTYFITTHAQILTSWVCVNPKYFKANPSRLTKYQDQEVGTYYEMFLAGYNLVKNSNGPKSFYWPRDHPLPHPSFKFQRHNFSQRGDITYQKFPFLDWGRLMKRFGPFCTRINIISTAFIGSKKQQ